MGNIEPIGHVPPYKRIDFNPVRIPEAPEPPDAFVLLKRGMEADRIWKLIRQSAEGCNEPPKAAPDVCTDGWDCA